MLTNLFNKIVKTILEKTTATEQHIKETAKKLFFVDGHLNATTQEIADAANVNRTLLNYYFRSRDALFEKVFQEAIQEKFDGMKMAFESLMPFRQKVERIIDIVSDYLNKYPYAEIFFISELNKKDARVDWCIKRPLQPYLKDFIKEIQVEIQKKNVRCKEPRIFLLTIFSLLSYPVIVKNLYINLYELSHKDFTEIAKNRKNYILSLLFNN